VGSRATWFGLGAVTGVVAALLLVWRAPETEPAGTRVIAVSPTPSAAFLSLGGAAARGRPGDVLRLEPGRYPEQVVLGDGVSLTARVPGTVTFVRAPVTGEDWVAVTAAGEAGGRVSGISIQSTSDLPIDVGIRVTGQSRAFDLVALSGPMRAGMELTPGSSATLHGAHFTVSAAAVALEDGSQLSAWSNIFVRSAGPLLPPIDLGTGAQVTLRNNVFVGHGADIVKGISLTARQQILAANVIVSAEPSQAR
jgi:hypothetical protein